MQQSKETAANLLAGAGIQINGPQPWDIQVHDERLYDRVFSGGSLAAGESYMDGWWDAEDLSGFFFRILRDGAAMKIMGIGILMQVIKANLFNLQNPKRAFEVGEKHYDIGNDLYQRMLDKRMIYSCGYWNGAATLDEAQEHKLDLICRKIHLKKGDTVLDIGCGWGGFAKFAAERYDAKVVGVTISKEQFEWAQTHTNGLDVEIRLQDWREIQDESFTHIVSIGMFEHVGPKNYRAFMEKASTLLSDEGFFLLHTIGNKNTTRNLEPWMNKYIFPNGHLPSMAQITKAFDSRLFGSPLFIMEDWHNFGVYYDKTLLAWHDNFERAWPDLAQNYSERFRRMWRYYLLSCAAAFRARNTHLWQMVFSKRGMIGGYQSIR